MVRQPVRVVRCKSQSFLVAFHGGTHPFGGSKPSETFLLVVLRVDRVRAGLGKFFRPGIFNQEQATTRY
jgi:hypothetical protein